MQRTESEIGDQVSRLSILAAPLTAGTVIAKEIDAMRDVLNNRLHDAHIAERFEPALHQAAADATRWLHGEEGALPPAEIAESRLAQMAQAAADQPRKNLEQTEATRAAGAGVKGSAPGMVTGGLTQALTPVDKNTEPQPGDGDNQGGQEAQPNTAPPAEQTQAQQPEQ